MRNFLEPLIMWNLTLPWEDLKKDQKLKRQIRGKDRLERLSEQLKYMTNEDIKMMKKVVKWLDIQYMNKTNSPVRNKRFGLATWILGWGVYRAYDSIGTIKDNIRALQ